MLLRFANLLASQNYSSRTKSMSSLSDWWNRNGALTAANYVYTASSPSARNARWNEKPASGSTVTGPDPATGEIFEGQRARGMAAPSIYSSSPFAKGDEFSPFNSPRFMPPVSLTPRAVENLSPFLRRLDRKERGPSSTVDTSWRSGDKMPFNLDGSPMRPRPPQPVVARDPDLAGYASKGSAGYGVEMLTGQKAIPRPPPVLDLQIAQWRPGAGEADPHPFTINGSVPASTPRQTNFGRHMQRELIAHTVEGDVLSAEAARRELVKSELSVHAGRHEDANESTNGGYFMQPRSVALSNEASLHLKGGSSWRQCDDQPFGFGEEVPKRRETNPIVSTSWRTYPKNGIGSVFGGPDEQPPPTGSSSPMTPRNRQKLPVELQATEGKEQRMERRGSGNHMFDEAQRYLPRVSPTLA